MRQSDPEVLTALTHRPWSLSCLGDGTPRFSSLWQHHWMRMMDILLDWAHHHLLWKLCGTSAFLIQKNVVSQWVEPVTPCLKFNTCSDVELPRQSRRLTFLSRRRVLHTLLMSTSSYVSFCLQGLCPVLGSKGSGSCSLDRQHKIGERLFPGGATHQLHHRQPCGRLWTSLLRHTANSCP